MLCVCMPSLYLLYRWKKKHEMICTRNVWEIVCLCVFTNYFNCAHNCIILLLTLLFYNYFFTPIYLSFLWYVCNTLTCKVGNSFLQISVFEILSMKLNIRIWWKTKWNYWSKKKRHTNKATTTSDLYHWFETFNK